MKKMVWPAFVSSVLLICSSTAIAQNTPTFHATAIEHIPRGILVGEFDTQPNSEAYNGLYYSGDLGDTWTEIGLASRGITDVQYHGETIYVTTYYNVENTLGLFKKNGNATEWVHVGNNMSLNSFKATTSTLYIGSYSHGLWVSENQGQTWIQKIGNGWYGPKIEILAAKDNIAIASTSDTTYITYDSGQTWEMLDALNTSVAQTAYVTGNDIIIGTTPPNGLYISNDGGRSWAAPEYFSDTQVTAITQLRDTYYIGLRVTGNNTYELHYGNPEIGWTNFGEIFSEDVIDLTWLLTEPPYVLGLISNHGIFKIEAITPPQADEAFLEIPWEYSTEVELTDKITAFFDHQYPLLGYPYYNEPEDHKDTTLNYLGLREKRPDMFYSSHTGVDFGLNYGTEILAPASGTAYYYYCEDCGHTIKIDHPNGYTTTYMHLQGTGLTTTSMKHVEQGEVLGLVGMTGRTTGPHLHFAVNNSEQYFKYTDPFGWQPPTMKDPWLSFTWTDINGEHTGTGSKYLWNTAVANSSQTIMEANEGITIGNKTVVTHESYPLNLTVRNHSQPYIPEIQQKLTYIKNTSLLVMASDLLGKTITNIEQPSSIIINFSPGDLGKILATTLKIHYLDENDYLWKALPTVIDLFSGVATAETDHFSWFALLGEYDNTGSDCKISNAKFTIAQIL